MSDPVISVENLGKCYRIYHASRKPVSAAATVRRWAVSPFRYLADRVRPPRDSELFWALRNVSFEIRQGEVLGIIGRNGAGKSTLLKILSRITDPTEGRARMRGRVNALLEVGTGFHPELTGRENIFMSAAMHGMHRAEILRKLDEIVSFAEVERFIDTPVKRYSSGMYTRLAFAVAASLDPDILVLDEVLAVGDVAFQKKCLGRMQAVAGEGRTVMFVSHNIQAVRQLCTRAIWMKGGTLHQEGSSTDVTDSYLKDDNGPSAAATAHEQIRGFPADPACRLLDVRLLQDGRDAGDVLSGTPLDICIGYEILKQAHGFHLTVELRDAEGTMLFDSLSNGDASELPTTPPGRYVSTCRLPADLLSPMQYELRIGAGIANVRACLPRPVSLPIHVSPTGRVNRAYPGYHTPGKLAPLLPWSHEVWKGDAYAQVPGL